MNRAEYAAAGGIINRFLFQPLCVVFVFDRAPDDCFGTQNEPCILRADIALSQMHALCPADQGDIHTVID